MHQTMQLGFGSHLLPPTNIRCHRCFLSSLLLLLSFFSSPPFFFISSEFFSTTALPPSPATPKATAMGRHEKHDSPTPCYGGWPENHYRFLPWWCHDRYSTTLKCLQIETFILNIFHK